MTAECLSKPSDSSGLSCCSPRRYRLKNCPLNTRNPVSCSSPRWLPPLLLPARLHLHLLRSPPTSCSMSPPSGPGLRPAVLHAQPPSQLVHASLSPVNHQVSTY